MLIYDQYKEYEPILKSTRKIFTQIEPKKWIYADVQSIEKLGKYFDPKSLREIDETVNGWKIYYKDTKVSRDYIKMLKVLSVTKKICYVEEFVGTTLVETQSPF